MPDIFLSYGHNDVATAERFAEGFGRAAFSVWWDAALRAGDAFDQSIERALKSAKAVLSLWPRSSVDSRWVRAGATLADRNKTLVPMMIGSCERPNMFELTHTPDLSRCRGDPNDEASQTGLAAVRRLVEGGAPGPRRWRPTTLSPLAASEKCDRRAAERQPTLASIGSIDEPSWSGDARELTRICQSTAEENQHV